MHAGESPESDDLRDVVEALGKAPALTVNMLAGKAIDLGCHDLASDLTDRKAGPRVPQMLDRAGCVLMRNPRMSRAQLLATIVTLGWR